ncbi:calcium-binding protein 7 [Neophocaena asiaeorientalis asiaeorientalis]|nr:calcium-binding protein 7 [Neophocaena asiaeorientalis asiaeorientalis]
MRDAKPSPVTSRVRGAKHAAEAFLSDSLVPSAEPGPEGASINISFALLAQTVRQFCLNPMALPLKDTITASPLLRQGPDWGSGMSACVSLTQVQNGSDVCAEKPPNAGFQGCALCPQPRGAILTRYPHCAGGTTLMSYSQISTVHLPADSQGVTNLRTCPFHPVSAALMYRGIYTVPNLLSEQRPVDIPEDELEEIREAFKVFDRDGNGFISKQELGTAMRSLGYMPNEVELEVIIQRLDMDGDGQVDFEEFVTLLGPKLSTSGIPEKFHGTDFDTVFWKCDMQKLTVDELKRLLYDTFCEHLSMKDIENIIMTEEESHLGTAEECPVDVETCSNQQIRQTCVRKSLICAFAIAFIISVMLIAANQVLRSGMK